MKVQTTEFRCDLCGRHEKIGVTETQATDEAHETKICAKCVARGVQHLAEHAHHLADAQGD